MKNEETTDLNIMIGIQLKLKFVAIPTDKEVWLREITCQTLCSENSGVEPRGNMYVCGVGEVNKGCPLDPWICPPQRDFNGKVLGGLHVAPVVVWDPSPSPLGPLIFKDTTAGRR